MNSPSMKSPESTSNQSKTPPSETFLARYRVSEFQEEKIRNYNQLQEFYMPHMKRVYEQMKQQNPSLKSPEDLLMNSQLLSMKEADMTRKIETLQRDNEAKEGRIRQMVKQIGGLVKRLKPFDPSVTESTTNFAEDNERLAKRYESLMKIKADETFFALKMKGMDLLKEFGLLKEEAEGINHMQTESEVFDFILNKLKLRIKDYKSREKQTTEVSYKEKAELDRYSERIQYLTETNEQLKNNEVRLKEKVEEVKKEWSAVCDRLIAKQKELEDRDNEIFRLRRQIDEKESAIVMTASKVTSDKDHMELKARDLEQQLRDMRVLLSMYNLEKSELQATIDEKQSEIEENRIRDKFNQEQYEKVLRQSARWKERFEWIEKDRDTKSKLLEKENFQMDSDIKILKVDLESQKIKYTELQTETEQLRLYNKKVNDDLTDREDQNLKLQKRCAELEESLSSKISHLEEEYASKYRNLQKQRDLQIANAIQAKEEEFRNQWFVLDKDRNVKLEELHKNFDSKLALQTAAHNRTLDQLAKVQQEYRELLQLIQREKAITTKVYTVNVGSPKFVPPKQVITSPRGTTSTMLPNASNYVVNHVVHPTNLHRTISQSNPVTPVQNSEQISAAIGEPSSGSRFYTRPVNGQNSFSFTSETSKQ